jgi:hypothetical protein
VKQGSISFLKKRNKKLLFSHPAQDARHEGMVGRGGGEQKFFGSFFQKGTASFAIRPGIIL